MSQKDLAEGPHPPDAAPAADPPIRVVIADDHALYRQSLRLVLTLDEDIEVVGEASDGYEALDLVMEATPDVLVIDLQMPRLGGVEVVRSLAEQLPAMKILMLTMSEENANLIRALQAGVSGYVTKDTSAEEVTDAVRQVSRGGLVISKAAAAGLVNAILSIQPEEFGNPRTSALINGNRALIRRLGRGASVAEIAQEDEVDEDIILGRLREILVAFRAATGAGAPVATGQ